jgi:hypothetical protein
MEAPMPIRAALAIVAFFLGLAGAQAQAKPARAQAPAPEALEAEEGSICDTGRRACVSPVAPVGANCFCNDPLLLSRGNVSPVPLSALGSRLVVCRIVSRICPTWAAPGAQCLCNNDPHDAGMGFAEAVSDPRK